MSAAMEPDFSTIGIIGPGRMGSALADALHYTGHAIHAIAGRSSESHRAIALAQRLGATVMTAQQLAKQCSLIILATPDDKLAHIANVLDWSAHSAVIHLSGATDISILQPAADQGAYIGSFHPLQSISQPIGSASTFQHCTISIEAAAPALKARLEQLAHSLGAHINLLPANARMRYHASANHASALLIGLLMDMAQLWESWGSNEKEMMTALLPLMEGTLSSAKTNGIAQALTGPLARGDINTLTGHLSALYALDPALAQRYALRHIALLHLAPESQRSTLEALLIEYAQR